MTLSEKISEALACLFFVVFVLGWIDVGQGPELTWWNLIYLLAK